MPRYAVVIEYDGTDLAGFQIQENADTVQAALERCAQTILRETVTFHPAGRTDSGVHATGQVASFECTSIIDTYRFVYSMNSMLGRSVQILHITAVPDDFHARFSCVAREYEYLIWNAAVPSPHLRGKALWFREHIPVEQINGELGQMLGELDWKSFTRHVYREENTKRYVDRMSLRKASESITGRTDLVIFSIRGNAFLHNMIRILVGTILDKASGRTSALLGDILASQNRMTAGMTAPPHGLYFRAAYYRTMPGVQGLCTADDYPLFGRRAKDTEVYSD
ncbi:MAG: tRNA pseudouridine(38-40) synthase TruA [Spirochaetia bacterium]|nr:tRNA pseudouridine(38-40) synthase TruA [Spirochaetia bacterium]